MIDKENYLMFIFPKKLERYKVFQFPKSLFNLSVVKTSDIPAKIGK